MGTGQPILETNNQLQHYEGPEHQLVVGEGILAEVHFLAELAVLIRDDRNLCTPRRAPSRDSASSYVSDWKFHINRVLTAR